MTDLWYFGSARPRAWFGWDSPDPVTAGDSSWTWDVEFATTPEQTTYARTSLSSFSNIGGDSGWIFSGIVEYRTRGADGVDTIHPVGQGKPDGLAAFMTDSAVDSVTFGWGIGSDDDIVGATVNMEIWVTTHARRVFESQAAA